MKHNIITVTVIDNLITITMGSHKREFALFKTESGEYQRWDFAEIGDGPYEQKWARFLARSKAIAEAPEIAISELSQLV